MILLSFNLLLWCSVQSSQRYITNQNQQQMGNKTFGVTLSSMDSLPSFLCPTKLIHIEHFGDVQAFYDMELKIEVFMKEFTFMYEGEQKYEFLDNVRSINKQSPYLVKLTRLIESKDEENVCNKTNKILCFFEYHPTTLKMMIQQRKSENKQFHQKEIIWFLNCLLKGQLQLNTHGNYHGDISPEFLYWNARTHYLTMFDSVFFDTTKAGYYRARSGTSYISPEILNNLAEKRSFPNFNPYKSDIFSIGMVILYCMTLTDPLVAYDMNKLQIDSYHVQNLLRISAKKYSQAVVNVTRSMLSEKTRSTSKEIIDELVRRGFIPQDIDRSAKSDRTSVTYR